VVSCFELLGATLGFVALTYAGSGIYQVIYSSIAIFVAIGGKLFFHAKVINDEWIAIIITSFGLILSFVETEIAGYDSAANNRIIGVVISIMSTVVFASNYLFVEHLMTGPNPPSPSDIQAKAGSFSFCTVFLYVTLYTIPSESSMILDSMVLSHASIMKILVSYFLLIISHFGHSWSYYRVMPFLGSVGTGLLQALRAVLVFLCSSFIYCPGHQEQCLTPIKFFSAFVVVSGVIYFTILKNKMKEEKTPI